MLSAPISLANTSQSSISRSGSSSRTFRGVSSCSAAVRTPSFMNFGSNGLMDMSLLPSIELFRLAVGGRPHPRPLGGAPRIDEIAAPALERNVLGTPHAERQRAGGGRAFSGGRDGHPATRA